MFASLLFHTRFHGYCNLNFSHVINRRLSINIKSVDFDSIAGEQYKTQKSKKRKKRSTKEQGSCEFECWKEMLLRSTCSRLANSFIENDFFVQKVQVLFQCLVFREFIVHYVKVVIIKTAILLLPLTARESTQGTEKKSGHSFDENTISC